MLVLRRKRGEKICIGDNITLTVLNVRGKVLKLGIEAPRGTRVLRAELQPFNPPVPAVPRCQVSTLDRTTVGGSA